jgi:mono/diheme cytochrome c family protein
MRRSFALARVTFLVAALSSAAPSPAARGPLTFNDIAPILFQHCAVCHRQGGPGPFSLSSYQEVRKRAGQIATVTKSRFMPPWLPEPGYGHFAGGQRLTDEQVRTIQEWVTQGAPEGTASGSPAAPKFQETGSSENRT